MSKDIKTSPSTKPPAYFMSMGVYNVRCFKEYQTIDLSDGEGKPARWTIILGENGTGKTTLLKCLTGFELIQTNPDDPSRYSLQPRALEFSNYGFYFKRNGTLFGDSSVGEAKFYLGTFNSFKKFQSLNGFNADPSTWSFLKEDHDLWIDEYSWPTIFAYGANRRMSNNGLKGSDDPVASLFSDHYSLINAEEWLKEAEYRALKAKDENTDQSFFENQYQLVKNILIQLLPDISDIRISSINRQKQQAGIEAHSKDGWVPLKDLSLGYTTLIAWIVDLASRLFHRYPESENPLKEPAVVLVDEN